MFRDIDIQATDTVVIDSEVTDFITEADAVIDGLLYPYYVTPITGAESLKIVIHLDNIARWLYQINIAKGIRRF